MFMSSGHWTNTGLTKWINNNLYNYDEDDEKSMNPKKWYDINNGGKLSDTRECIYGFPCRLILVNDGDTPLNEGQNEPTPGNTKDMGIFNFNHDKDATDTMGFDTDVFPNCASYEVTANSDTSAGAFMSYKEPITIKIKTNFVPVSLIGSVGDSIVEDTSYSYWSGFWDSGKATRIEWSNYYPKAIPADAAYFEIVSYETNDDGLEERLVRTDKGRQILIIKDTSISEEYVIVDNGELEYIKQSFELRFPDEDDVAEDWGFMGVESSIKIIDYAMSGTTQYSTKIPYTYIGSKTFTVEIPGVTYAIERLNEDNSIYVPQYGMSGKQTITLADNEDYIRIYSATTWDTLILNDISYKKGEQVAHQDTIKAPYESIVFDTSYGLKALIDWVDNCTDEEFVADFEEHFHKDYTLRYFLLVITLG